MKMHVLVYLAALKELDKRNTMWVPVAYQQNGVINLALQQIRNIGYSNCWKIFTRAIAYCELCIRTVLGTKVAFEFHAQTIKMDCVRCICVQMNIFLYSVSCNIISTKEIDSQIEKFFCKWLYLKFLGHTNFVICPVLKGGRELPANKLQLYDFFHLVKENCQGSGNAVRRSRCLLLSGAWLNFPLM